MFCPLKHEKTQPKKKDTLAEIFSTALTCPICPKTKQKLIWVFIALKNIYRFLAHRHRWNGARRRSTKKIWYVILLVKSAKQSLRNDLRVVSQLVITENFMGFNSFANITTQISERNVTMACKIANSIKLFFFKYKWQFKFLVNCHSHHQSSANTK